MQTPDILEFLSVRRAALMEEVAAIDNFVAAYGVQTGETPIEQPPVKEPPVDMPPVEQPPVDETPNPAPAPDPATPAPPTVPATPKPANDFASVDAIRSRAREIIDASGVKVTATNIDIAAWPSFDQGYPVPAGVTVKPNEVVVGKGFVGDLQASATIGINIGKRQLTLAAGADVGVVKIYGMAPNSMQAGVKVDVSARARSLNSSILDGSLGVSKAIFQSHSGSGNTAKIGSIDEVVDCDFINQKGDGPKLAGSHFGRVLVSGNLFAQQERAYAGAHYDLTTLINGLGGFDIVGNIYDQLLDDDTEGENNLIQFAPYWPGAIYGDIKVSKNIFTHLNPNSFGFMKGSNHIASARFGRIDIDDNWFRKAGDIRTIFYKKNNFATSFARNINLDTGQVFSI